MKLWVTLLLAILFLSACRHEEKFAVKPEIRFISLEKTDDGTGIDHRAKLTFHFQDGDGDIGLDADDVDAPFDTTSVYYYNCFINYYKKKDGQFQLIEFEGITFNQRIPRLSTEESESIEGTVSIDLDISNPFHSTPPATDTIQYSLYIVDRALNESNAIETPPLVVRYK